MSEELDVMDRAVCWRRKDPARAVVMVGDKQAWLATGFEGGFEKKATDVS